MTRKEERSQAALEYAKTLIDYAHSELAIKACSALGHAHIIGSVWADQTMIDKACKWLDSYLETTEKSLLIADFRKAMQE